MIKRILAILALGSVLVHAQIVSESSATISAYNSGGKAFSATATTGNVDVSGVQSSMTLGTMYNGQWKSTIVATGSGGSSGTVSGQLTIYDAKWNKVTGPVAANGTINLPSWYTPDTYYVTYNFQVTISAPTPTPTPTPNPTPTPTPGAQPKRGSSPYVSAVSNCPNLVFYDDFNEPNFNTTMLSNWGPLAPQAQTTAKWIVHKPDGYDYGGYSQGPSDAATYFNGPGTGYSSSENSTGFLTLQLHNYYQDATVNPKGDGNWFHGQIASAAYVNGGAVNGKTSGFLTSAPSYWEVAMWIPQLTDCDVPNAAGLWPSISCYGDPSVPGTTAAPGVEIDWPEMYSANFKVANLSVHSWVNGSQVAYPATAGFQYQGTSDLSAGWHIWGLWLDGIAATGAPLGNVHFYLDGKEIWTWPMPPGFNAPLFLQITNGSGPGPVSLVPGELYPLKISYVSVWSHP